MQIADLLLVFFDLLIKIGHLLLVFPDQQVKIVNLRLILRNNNLRKAERLRPEGLNHITNQGIMQGAELLAPNLGGGFVQEGRRKLDKAVHIRKIGCQPHRNP